MSSPVKILIIEPSVIIRNGILSVLHQLNNIQSEVSELSGPEQLKSSPDWYKTDLLLINPSILSMISLKQIKKEISNPKLRCVAIQSSLVDLSSGKMYDGIISIYDSVEQINEKLIGLIRDPEGEKPQETLTSREKEIIVCVIKGMTNKEIAEHLCLSSHTVISHRRNISYKLQIHSTAGLTIYAIVNKLIELPDIKK